MTELDWCGQKKIGRIHGHQTLHRPAESAPSELHVTPYALPFEAYLWSTQFDRGFLRNWFYYAPFVRSRRNSGSTKVGIQMEKIRRVWHTEWDWPINIWGIKNNLVYVPPWAAVDTTVNPWRRRAFWQEMFSFYQWCFFAFFDCCIHFSSCFRQSFIQPRSALFSWFSISASWMLRL